MRKPILREPKSQRCTHASSPSFASESFSHLQPFSAGRDGASLGTAAAIGNAPARKTVMSRYWRLFMCHEFTLSIGTYDQTVGAHGCAKKRPGDGQVQITVILSVGWAGPRGAKDLRADRGSEPGFVRRSFAPTPAPTLSLRMTVGWFGALDEEGGTLQTRITTGSFLEARPGG